MPVMSHAALLGKMLLLAPRLAKEQGLDNGFRTVINTGKGGGQEIFHLHIHVIGGGNIPPMVRRKLMVCNNLKENEMGGLSIWHWLIVLLVIVLIFGTKKLRNIGSDLGGAVKGFKEGMRSEEEPAKQIKEGGQTIEGEVKDKKTTNV